jgi:arylsulfatase A-like enzyme
MSLRERALATLWQMRIAIFVALLASLPAQAEPRPKPPNVVLIYADDVGYGDLSCYGATAVATPNLDRLAKEGIRFTDAHSSSATCTPSRYSLLTGEYAFRKPGTAVLPGDARLILDPKQATLASLLRRGGYVSGVIGKWHLGLGNGDLDWNGDIAPGPLEVGFDECWLMPATGDRVPCVYVDGHLVAHLDANDPIRVSYRERIDPRPSGKERPDLLRMKWDHGHDMTIVDGISRIGWMTGGAKAQWKDAEMADVFAAHATDFVRRAKSIPFFLLFCPHDIHVPRVPHGRFVGKTEMGPRGDALVQLDWQVGEVLRTLDELGIADDTIVVFTSDNGPVVNDGYVDDAVAKLGDHKPAGPLRGGKYSAFEGGTRVPFLVRWPARCKPRVSDALVSQVDACATVAAMCSVALAEGECPDSSDQRRAWLGEDEVGRASLIEHAGSLALRMGKWKFIPQSNRPKVSKQVGIELGNDDRPQLYDLSKDLGETNNLAESEPERAAEMAQALESMTSERR